MASKDNNLCVEEDGHGRLKINSTSNENAATLSTVQQHILNVDQLDWSRAWDNQQSTQNFQSLLNLNERSHNNEPSKRGSSSSRVKTEQISPFTKYVTN